MNDNVFAAISRLHDVTGALACEPFITPDLSRLPDARLPVVILAAIGRGVDEFNPIYDFLAERGRCVDPEDLLEILAEHEGADPSVSLWHRGEGYRYRPLHRAG